MATTRSISFLRPTYPWRLARIVYQVGSPAMFEGNRFLPDTGIPIWKIDRIRIRLAVWLPDPFTVATWMLKSLTMRCGERPADRGLARKVRRRHAAS
jgi:hypothetical protein